MKKPPQSGVLTIGEEKKMPLVLIYGIHSPDVPKIDGLARDIKKAVASVEELKITEKQVSVFFPRDMNGIPRSQEIIALVEGFYEKPERTANVRNKVATEITRALKCYANEYLEHCRFIEVILKTYNPFGGCVTIEIPEEEREATAERKKNSRKATKRY